MDSVSDLLRPDLCDVTAAAKRLALRSVPYASRVLNSAGVEAVGHIGNTIVYRVADVEALAEKRRHMVNARSPKVA